MQTLMFNELDTETQTQALKTYGEDARNGKFNVIGGVILSMSITN